MRPGGALVFDQRFDVDGSLDLLTSIPAAHVVRQLLCAVQDANPVFVGQHAQGAAHMGVRHRVVVQIEADVGRLARRHGPAFRQLVLALGQRHQGGLLGMEGLPHAQGRVLRPPPIRRRALAPQPRLGVQVVQVGVGAGGEEVVANVADRAFDPALLVATRHGHRTRLVAVVTSELQ